jgi:hypothetical protein
MGALITPSGLGVRKIWVCPRLESTGRGAEGIGPLTNPHLVRASQSIQLEESERRQWPDNLPTTMPTLTLLRRSRHRCHRGGLPRRLPCFGEWTVAPENGILPRPSDLGDRFQSALMVLAAGTLVVLAC